MQLASTMLLIGCYQLMSLFSRPRTKDTCQFFIDAFVNTSEAFAAHLYVSADAASICAMVALAYRFFQLLINVITL